MTLLWDMAFPLTVLFFFVMVLGILDLVTRTGTEKDDPQGD